jgi:PncC family amidohydrolase
MESLGSLAETISGLLKERDETVAVAESSAGGLISATLLAVPGASAYFIGGSVVYTRTAQRGLLDVGDDLMDGLRASTEEYATVNAMKVRNLLGTTWGLAETGASGPTGNRYGDSAGHACIAVSGPVEKAMTLETGRADREQNMWTFTKTALDLLEQCVREAS